MKQLIKKIILPVLIIVCFSCGIYGFYTCECLERSHSLFDIFYRTLQLITLESGDINNPNIYQEIARFSLPVITIYTIIVNIIKPIKESLFEKIKNSIKNPMLEYVSYF